MRIPSSIHQYLRIFFIVNITTYTTVSAITMAPGKKADENTKKAAGNAKKAEIAAQKAAAVEARQVDEEDREWSKGAKSNAKKEAAAAKQASAAAAKAERAALLAAEEASQRPMPKGTGAKTATKKTRGTLNLDALDGEPADSKRETTLNASGIDNALDALSLTAAPGAEKVERHPERRFKAAYKAFEERRLPEVEDEHPGLRKQQRAEIVRKEFEKSPENPFNQVGVVGYDATKEEAREVKRREREGVEGRLGEKGR